VKYNDTAGTEQTITPADYVLDDFDDVATLGCAYNVDWPNIPYSVRDILDNFRVWKL